MQSAVASRTVNNHPERHFTVANGSLVRMKRPGSTKITEVSVPCVGHELAQGSVIVDTAGKPIEPKQMFIQRGPKPQRVEVIDPGEHYNIVFDPAVPPHFAAVPKTR